MRVLLVHGLARTPACLLRLAWRLRRAGHRPLLFGYAAWAEPYPRIVSRLVLRLESLARAGEPVGLVGHSLGGLLLRSALAAVPGLRVSRLVLLGTPNQPPRIASRARRWPLFRAMSRSCGALLASPSEFGRIPAPSVPYTIIAGSAGWRVAGWFGGEPNDGIVAVSETLVHPGDEPQVFPVWHAFLVSDRDVARAVLRALSAPGPGVP
jgi:hypothetical protein